MKSKSKKIILGLMLVSIVVIVIATIEVVPGTKEERATYDALFSLKHQHFAYIAENPRLDSAVELKSILEKTVLKDGWGRRFEMIKIGEKKIVRSAGKDGQFGTKDDIDW